MNRLAKNSKVNTSHIVIDPRATLPRLEIGDGIHVAYTNADGKPVNRSGIIKIMRPTSTGNYSVSTDTGVRFILSADRTAAVNPGITVKLANTAAEIAANAARPTPRGWSQYSRPQGTCQYCGAPCADTPSPTCDEC